MPYVPGGGGDPPFSPTTPLMCCVFNCACAGVTPRAHASRLPASTFRETRIRGTGLSFLGVATLPLNGARRLRRSPSCPTRDSCDLLPRHRQLESLLGADQVVSVLGRRINIDLPPVDIPAERIPAQAVVRRHRLADVAANLQRLVHREEQGMR